MIVTLLPAKAVYTIEEIAERFGRDVPVAVCDFYLAGIERRGREEAYGLRYENILNLDHHAPLARFERQVSSATLAVEYVQTLGPWREGPVAINHTDCDSMLSSMVLCGLLPADARFSAAAIAADHTGEPDAVADLLQSLEGLRDIDFSARNLRHLLSGEPIEPEAAIRLRERLAEREAARALVESGAFRFTGGVAYAEAACKLDGAFLPALLPQAAVILLGNPFRGPDGVAIPGRWEVRIRLGKSAPAGVTLQALGLEKTPIRFQGRWNAGSNRRSGGTAVTVRDCAEIVAVRLLKTYQR